MPEILNVTRFGNPILRRVAKKLSASEILSDDIQDLIANMRYTLLEKEYGVGIAAPQVGQSVALSVIGVKPTPNRPQLETFDAVLINPEVIETFGDPVDAWEACVSCGTGDDILFAKVPRHEKIKLTYMDEQANECEQIVEGFLAQLFQHETDHLNGVLFVDHVTDSTSFIMGDEYKKRVLGQ